MLKRLLFLLILCMISFITGCTNNKPPEVESIATHELASEADNPLESGSDISAWIELPSINIEPGVSEGVTKAETETSSYEFHGRAEEENIRLAHINEIAVLVLRHEYGYSPPKGRLIHFIEEEGIWIGELSLEVQQIVASNGRTVINPDSPRSVGALFYGSSRNLLPAWLSAGLELYWSDRFGFERIAFDKELDLNAWKLKAEDVPAFGDVWFEVSNAESRLSAVFSFVQWLDEKAMLNEIVRAYLADKQAEGDLLFADAWLQFTGQDIRGDFFFDSRLRYLYGTYLRTFNLDTQTYDFDDFAFSALTDQAYYFFDCLFWGDNIFKDMEEFINAIDTQYAYAKQWLGFEDAAPIPTRIPFKRRAGATGGAEYVSLPGGGNWGVAVHEAFHHLLHFNNIHPEFKWLDEGLPEAIGFIYAYEDTEVYAPLHYYVVTGRNNYDGTFDFIRHAHMMALQAVNYFEEHDRYGRRYTQRDGQLGIRAEDKPSDFPQGFLNTYRTSASFVLYMLEIGSKEDFMRLYVDTSVAEELYGKDFNSLYEQWLEFLKQL